MHDWARKKTRQEVLRCAPGVNPAVPLDALLVFLCRNGSESCMWLWKQVVSWLAWIIEAGSLWGTAASDPVDIPAPRGARRVRRMHPQMTNALAKLAGEGVVARTGAKMAKVLKLALRRRGLAHGAGDSAANEAQKTRAKRYRESAGAAFHHANVSVLSVAMDASRVVGKETLYSALWSCETKQGCWGDPMVKRAIWKKLKHPVWKTRSKHLLFLFKIVENPLNTVEHR